ncbi:unnamed protein product [Gadus morhua 'NCC']
MFPFEPERVPGERAMHHTEALLILARLWKGSWDGGGGPASQTLPTPLRRWFWWMVVESWPPILMSNLITQVFWECEDERATETKESYRRRQTQALCWENTAAGKDASQPSTRLYQWNLSFLP